MGKILLYGGTFDPPHKGHRHLLQAALEQAEFERVFLIPAYVPPHKDRRPALSFEARKGVLKDYFCDIPNLEVLDIEEKLGGKSYTIHTVEALEAQYPNETLYFLMGSDMFLSFEQWVQFETLLKKLILVVGSREEGDYEQLNAQRERLLKQYSCKGILLCSTKPIVCASSEIRNVGGGAAGRVLAYIGEEMDEKRARHTMQVAEYAADLADRLGIDREKAYLAGLLHDCTKFRSDDWHIQYAAEHNLTLSADDLACPQILHQITAPIFARENFGIKDAEILSAIGCHTTGKVKMTDLEMLLFFADSCEPSRTYSGVDQLREAGEDDLKYGTLMLLNHIIAFLKDRNAYLHPLTVAARDDLLKEFKKE